MKATVLSHCLFVDYSNQVSDKEVLIGFTTKQLSNRLHQGDITDHQHKKFVKAAREFLMCATEYLLKWCSLENELLTACTWLTIEQRVQNSFLSVEYFVQSVKESANLEDKDTRHVDVLWGYLRGVKELGTNDLQFGLFKVAEVMMTIPHSNVGEERIFSLINKNKTPSRSSLKLDGTLSSLIVVKTHIDNPIQWTPSEAMLQKAKDATRAYNEQLKSRS